MNKTEKKKVKEQHTEVNGLLNRGEENAVTARDLAAITGHSIREITAQIARERQAGAVILSSGKGYFLPANNEEILHFVRAMDSRARNIYLATRSAKSILAKVPGQLEIDEKEVGQLL